MEVHSVNSAQSLRLRAFVVKSWPEPQIPKPIQGSLERFSKATQGYPRLPKVTQGIFRKKDCLFFRSFGGSQFPSSVVANPYRPKSRPFQTYARHKIILNVMLILILKKGFLEFLGIWSFSGAWMLGFGCFQNGLADRTRPKADLFKPIQGKKFTPSPTEMGSATVSVAVFGVSPNTPLPILPLPNPYPPLPPKHRPIQAYAS
jgi:hypothetical protein